MPHQDLIKMKKHLGDAQSTLETLSANAVTFEKHNELSETAAVQFELAVLEFRKLCEKNKMPVRDNPPKGSILQSNEVFGEVEVTENDWLHIRINTLLPSTKLIVNSRYISDSITQLLNHFVAYGGTLPFFEKAFLAIIERCNFKGRKIYDHDNKAFAPVINALKGRLFADDNQFEMSLGLFSEFDGENACHIYVVPEYDAADFLYQRNMGSGGPADSTLDGCENASFF